MEPKEIDWFSYKDAWPVSEADKEEWIRELLNPEKHEHIRANFIMSGDTMVLVLHSGADLEVFELKTQRHAYVAGAGRDTTEYPTAVYKKPEGG